MRQYGTCVMPCTYQDTKNDTELFVTEAEGPVILGLPTAMKLKMITLNCSIEENGQTKHKDPERLSRHTYFRGNIAKTKRCYHLLNHRCKVWALEC